MLKTAVLLTLFALLTAEQLVTRRKEQKDCRSSDLAKANRLFAFELFHQIARENPDGNIFISPLVIDMGLSMLMEGARGKTQEELEAVLQLRNVSLNSRKDNLGCLYEKFNSNIQPKLTTAVKMFGEKTTNFLNQFLYQTSLYAGNKLQEEDFANNPEKARTEINNWVSQQTAGRIDELFSDGSITSMTKLALASVLYFKGEWATPFTTNFSSEFFLNFTSHVPINMMSEKLDVRYIYDGTTQAYFVELPYKSEETALDVSMILILDVNDGRGFSPVERSLSEESVESAISRLLNAEPRNVEILLPMFNLEASYDLIDTLNAMGLGSLFNPSADLSGIAKQAQNLYVSTAVQKTFLAIDKQGTEAAGAFGFGVVALSIPFDLRFNRPFHLLIYEKNARSILFMGRIANPNL